MKKKPQPIYGISPELGEVEIRDGVVHPLKFKTRVKIKGLVGWTATVSPEDKEAVFEALKERFPGCVIIEEKPK